MEMRQKISLFLLLAGLMLAILPLTGNRSFNVKPETLLRQVLDREVSFSVDQVAKMIIDQDSSVRLIDLRDNEQFMKASLPGAINVPYAKFINADPDIYLNNKKIITIFYAEDDYFSNFALVFSRGLGYKNTYVMDGGLVEWYRTVTGSRFTGTRISARENAIFEIRARATRMFNEINSLPDSLKAERLSSTRFSARKLDGGCE
jgi:rhodanese-related sulfurtransferase